MTCYAIKDQVIDLYDIELIMPAEFISRIDTASLDIPYQLFQFGVGSGLMIFKSPANASTFQ